MLKLVKDRPIWQAPMAGAQSWELCLACSSTKTGVGAIPCAMVGEEDAWLAVGKVRAVLGAEAPINLNFFSTSGPLVGALTAQERRQALGWGAKAAAAARKLGVDV